MNLAASAHQIQFQKGLGILEFQQRYGTEQQCRDALKSWRWPEGFLCPLCKSRRHWNLKRPLLKCADCGRETSLTAGTLFHSTKLQLQTWFLGIYFFTQTKTGLSTLDLKRHLGVNVKTASLMQHKLMETMRLAEHERKISGTVELLDGCVGNHLTSRSKRVSQDRLPFIMAVGTSPRSDEFIASIEPVPSFRSSVIRNWAARHLDADSRVITASRSGFEGIRLAGHSLFRVTCTHGIGGSKDPHFWSRTLLKNLVTALAGVRHQTIHKYRARFFALFQFRLNHRFELKRIAETVLQLAACTCEKPRRILMAVEIRGQS